MRNRLIAATLGEVVLLVVVLAGYLIAIADRLRRISATLGQVTFGVRAIETQTAPVGPAVRDINAALEQVAGALGEAAADTSLDPAAEPRGGQAPT